jgi:amino acid permease/DNA-binding MarR family transcriptional regulator
VPVPTSEPSDGSPDDPFGGLLDRDTVLGGLPARRANTLLYLIESRTAQLTASSRRAMNTLLTDEAAKEADLAYLSAFAAGADPPRRPTIHDLERQAPRWQTLVPENPRIRAALAHRLGEKYSFRHAAVPNLRQAVGLDDEPVRRAYRRLYREPIASIYAARATPMATLRWAWTALAGRLESLPAFWIAYALTLTETIGVTILALPIALAGVGPLPGVVLLVLLGLLNVITIAYVAEAVARSGSIRYGSGFIGKVVDDYLGRAGSLVLTLGIFAVCFLVLQVFYVGFATTLQETTGVPAGFWVVVLFAIGILFLRKGSLDATVASSLVVGAVNVTLVIALSVIGFTQVQPTNLLYAEVPFVGGRALDRELVGLVFGVVLTAYFGHLSVSTCARVSLKRDPSARSLIWGAAAAQVTAIGLYSLFVLAVNGSVAPQTLAATTGTVLGPLAAQVGPIIYVLGSVFVVLGMGMGSLQYSVVLFNLVRERLPSLSQTVLVLPRRHGRLLFGAGRRSGPRAGSRLGLIYEGFDGGAPRFRLDAETNGTVRRIETTVSGGRWEILGPQADPALLAGVEDVAERGGELRLEVMEADPLRTRIHVTSSLRPTYEGGPDAIGLELAALLELSDAEAALIAWLTRRGGASLAQVAGHLELSESDSSAILAELVTDGLVRRTERDGQPRYETRQATRRGRSGSADLLRTLNLGADDQAVPETVVREPTRTPSRRRLLERLAASKLGTFALGVAPIVVAFALAEWSLLTGTGSFTGLLSVVGVVIIPVLGGIFPVLLLFASRRKGERVPTAGYRFLGNRILLIGIYVVFLGSIVLHGLVIWTDPVLRGVALAAGVAVVVMTWSVRNAFAARLNVELRQEDGPAQQSQGFFSVVCGGEPRASEVRLTYPAAEQRIDAATGEVPDFASVQQVGVTPGQRSSARPPGQLKVWVHRITATEDSEGLNAQLHVRDAGTTQRFDLALHEGTVVLPLASAAPEVRITFPARGRGASAADDG